MVVRMGMPLEFNVLFGPFLMGVVVSFIISLVNLNYYRRLSLVERDKAHGLEELVFRHTHQLRKLSRAVEQSPSSIFITNLKGTIEFVNPAFSRATGYTQEEAVGQNPRILNSGHQDEAFYQAMWDTLNKGDVWQGDMLNRRKDGSCYWEFVTISSIKDKIGKTTHYVAVKENISARKLAEQALKESEEHLGMAMSVANDGIWDWHMDDDTLSFNERYYTMAGYE
ncbi:MAG: PAS domain S-box protein, partial [Gammaproteobacteria bacterium]|nr:PAS domain S-box protein [Gammaproteobacteria bacterium]